MAGKLKKLLRHVKFHGTLTLLMIAFLLVNIHRTVVAAVDCVVWLLKQILWKTSSVLRWMADKLNDHGTKNLRKLQMSKYSPIFCKRLTEIAQEVIDKGPEGK